MEFLRSFCPEDKGMFVQILEFTQIKTGDLRLTIFANLMGEGKT